jgi:hypothetical protein
MRDAVGCELDAEFLTLSVRRLCSNLVQLEISVATMQFSVDPPTDPMDRSCSGRSSDRSASASERRRSRSARFPKRAGFCSGRGLSRAAFDFSCMSPQLQLVQQERPSISSAAPNVKSSSPSKPTPSTKPAKNSAAPATPTPTPSSSSRLKPKSTSPKRGFALLARPSFEWCGPRPHSCMVQRPSVHTSDIGHCSNNSRH